MLQLQQRIKSLEAHRRESGNRRRTLVIATLCLTTPATKIAMPLSYVAPGMQKQRRHACCRSKGPKLSSFGWRTGRCRSSSTWIQR
jgi:hypothetical protein